MDDINQPFPTARAPAPHSLFSHSDWKRFQDGVHALVPVLLVDDRGTIQRVTPTARRLLEYATDETIDRCFFAHVHARNQRRVMQDLAQVMRRHKRRVAWLLRLMTGSGRWRWFRAVAHPYSSDDQDLVAVRLRPV